LFQRYSGQKAFHCKGVPQHRGITTFVAAVFMSDIGQLEDATQSALPIGTKLDGVIAGGTYHWPGPLHLGNGTFQPYLSDKTTEKQREALLTILSGKAGNAGFEVVASVITKVLDPKYVPIEFKFDLKTHKALVSARSTRAFCQPSPGLSGIGHAR